MLSGCGSLALGLLHLVDYFMQPSYDEGVATASRTSEMTFGSQIRELRQAKHLTLRDVAKRVNVTFTYLSKIENQKLSFGEFPSDDLIVRLARVLEADPDELLLLAEKIPDAIRRRVLERPDVFRKMANLDDRRLDRVMAFLENEEH
jgi:HTH-type transcriptional regulator, competence development regulator